MLKIELFTIQIKYNVILNDANFIAKPRTKILTSIDNVLIHHFKCDITNHITFSHNHQINHTNNQVLYYCLEYIGIILDESTGHYIFIVRVSNNRNPHVNFYYI